MVGLGEGRHCLVGRRKWWRKLCLLLLLERLSSSLLWLSSHMGPVLPHTGSMEKQACFESTPWYVVAG